MWDVCYAYIEDWLDEQDEETVALVFAALEVLRDAGPSLGRPLVDLVKGTNVKNMKELRPASTGKSEVRILFAFDSRRKAVLLLAGDKSKAKRGRQKWDGWYKAAIPKAEAIYARHLQRLEGDDG